MGDYLMFGVIVLVCLGVLYTVWAVTVGGDLRGPGDRAMTQSNTGSYGNDQPAEGEKLAQPIHYVAPKKFTKFLSL